MVTRVYTHMVTHIWSPGCTHIWSHTYGHQGVHTYGHTHMVTRVYTHMVTHIWSPGCTHIWSHTYGHTHMVTRVYTHKYYHLVTSVHISNVISLMWVCCYVTMSSAHLQDKHHFSSALFASVTPQHIPHPGCPQSWGSQACFPGERGSTHCHRVCPACKEL